MDKNGSDNTGHGHGTADAGRLRLASIDHEEYDALADLFLGDGGFAPEPIVETRDETAQELVSSGFSGAEADTEAAGEILSVDTPVVDTPAVDELAVDEAEIDEMVVDEESSLDECDDLPTHISHTPVLQLTRHEDDAQLGGDFSRSDHEESFDVQGAGLHVLETLAATDARASELLVELMGESGLGEVFSNTLEDDSAGKIEFVAMPDPIVEVVVLGHLPVRATLWARQYACNQAKELCETVALVRAASGSTSVDLISNSGELGESVSLRSYERLEEALAAVSTLADRVIMRVDESSEGELLDRAEVEEITVLTGADEAAVVASYRLIKTLDATLGELYVEGEGPTLRVAVMGAAREAAMDACTKLENAVETFIQRPIEILVGSGRIDATGTTNLYRDSSAHRAMDILDGLVRAARVEGAEAPGSLELVDERAEALVEVEFPAGGVRVPDRGDADLNQDDGVVDQGLEDTEAACPVEGPAASSVSAPVVDNDDAPTLRDGLSAMISGLKPIEARCPKAPGVDLAVDDRGRLHLIVCDADTQDAMNRLLAAQTWARNNLGLLIRAEAGISVPDHDRDVDTDATMHLISMEPRNVREIYDTQVRIYSLARVKVAGVIAQVATPIN